MNGYVVVGVVGGAQCYYYLMTKFIWSDYGNLQSTLCAFAV